MLPALSLGGVGGNGPSAAGTGEQQSNGNSVSFGGARKSPDNIQAAITTAGVVVVALLVVYAYKQSQS